MSLIAPVQEFFAKKISKILIGGILLFIAMGGLGLILVTKAQSAPQNITASTFGSNTFTVSFFTNAKTPAELIVADNKDFKNPMKFNDARDFTVFGEPLQPSSRYSHILVARGLEPNKQYWYKVATTYNEVKNTDFFVVNTPSVSDDVPAPQPVYGQVVDKNGDPVANIIVQAQAIQADGVSSSVITSYTTENGSYTLDLANLRDSTLNKYWTPAKEVPVLVRVSVYSNKESYYYDTYDLTKLTPVQTFAFKSVEGYSHNNDKKDLFAQLVSKASAADKCENAKHRTYDYCATKADAGGQYDGKRCGDLAAEAENKCRTAFQGCGNLGDHTYGVCMQKFGDKKEDARATKCGYIAQGVKNQCGDDERSGNTGGSSNSGGSTSGGTSGGSSSGGQAAPAQDACYIVHTKYKEYMASPAVNGNPCLAGSLARRDSNYACAGYGKQDGDEDPYKKCGVPAPGSQQPSQPSQPSNPATPTQKPAGSTGTQNNVAITPACGGKTYKTHSTKVTYYCEKDMAFQCPDSPVKAATSPWKEGDCHYTPAPAAPAETPVNGCFTYREGNSYKCQQITFNKSNEKIITAGVVTNNALCGSNNIAKAEIGKMLEGQGCQTIQTAVVQPQSTSTPAPVAATQAPAPTSSSPTTTPNPAATPDAKNQQLVPGRTANTTITCKSPLKSFSINTGDGWTLGNYCVNNVFTDRKGGSQAICNLDGWTADKKTSSNAIDTSNYVGYQGVGCNEGYTCKEAGVQSIGTKLGRCIQNETVNVPAPDAPKVPENMICKSMNDSCTFLDTAGKPQTGACTKDLGCMITRPDNEACDEGNDKICRSGHCGPKRKITGQIVCTSQQEYDQLKAEEKAKADADARANATKVLCEGKADNTAVKMPDGKNGYCYRGYATPYSQRGEMCGGAVSTQCDPSANLACANFGGFMKCTDKAKAAELDTAFKVNCQKLLEPGIGTLCFTGSGYGTCTASKTISNVFNCENPIAKYSQPALVSPLSSNDGFNNTNVSISSGQKLDAGTYQLTNGTTLNLTSPATINFYVDANGNGVRDANEQLVTNKSYELQKQSDAFKYDLLNGWNAVNFPFYQDSSRPFKASDIRTIAASQDIDIISIKRWEGKWIEYSVQNGAVYGQDFVIRPNDGYFIRSTSRGSLNIFGTTPKTSVPMQLLNGWSLVGVAPGYGENKAKNYNQASFKDGIQAFEFLDVINKADAGIAADNLTKYDSGVYRGVSLGDGANGKKIQFGLDYTVDDLSAYFVRAKKKVTIAP
jgi:cell division septation protein DedD